MKFAVLIMNGEAGVIKKQINGIWQMRVKRKCATSWEKANKLLIKE